MSIRSKVNSLASIAKRSSFPNYLIRYNPLLYRRVAHAMRTIHTNPSASDEVRAQLLHRMLSWATETEYGRGRRPNLRDWPILTQEEVKASPERFRRRTMFSIPAATGGSTGRPLKLWRSFECIVAEQAAIDSRLCDPTIPMLKQRVAVLRADFVKDPADTKPPFGVWRNNRRWLVLSNAHLSPTTFSWYLETLSSFKPAVLWVYPTSLSNLIRLIRQSGLSLSVPTVLSSSESMTTSLFADAREALGARVVDHYGHNERVCSAYSDSEGRYRFDNAYGHVELIRDSEQRSTPSGISTARIIATGYWNSAFPLVRYDTGDRAIISESDSSETIALVAASQRRFSGILGRSDDYIIGRDGERIVGLNHIPIELDSVFQIQIVQEGVHKIRIRALSKRELTNSDRDRIQRNARELVPPYMSVDIESANELLTLSNGKTPFIIRDLRHD